MKLGLLHSRVIVIRRKVLDNLKLNHNCFSELYKIQKRSPLLPKSSLKSNSIVNRKSQPINIMSNSASQAKSTGFWRFAKTISRNVYILISLLLNAHQSKSQVCVFSKNHSSNGSGIVPSRNCLVNTSWVMISFRRLLPFIEKLSFAYQSSDVLRTVSQEYLKPGYQLKFFFT